MSSVVIIHQNDAETAPVQYDKQMPIKLTEYGYWILHFTTLQYSKLVLY